jgi:hypothetical protein
VGCQPALTMHDPIMELREDVLNFIDATVEGSDSEIARVGYRFARLIKEYAEEQSLMDTKEFFEICLAMSEM